MSETILIKKKKEEEKKKEFNLKKAVEETMPLVVNYRKCLGELVTKTYNVYLDCQDQEEWELYCNEIGFSCRTIDQWHREHNLPSKTFLINHEFGEPFADSANDENNINEQIETETDEVEILKYKQTYGILKNAQRLSVNMFKVDQKEKLIQELQFTIKKLNGLLLRLESNIGDD